MKLAEAKRRATAGTVLIAENHIRPQASGPRTVIKVQTNGLWVVRDEGTRRYWMEWPKAALCIDLGPGRPDSIQLLAEPGSPLVTLTFPPQSDDQRGARGPAEA